MLDPIDPIQTSLSITNASFIAQTVDWNPAHLYATLAAAHKHPGFAFVRILQRCPHFKPGLFDAEMSDPARMLLMTHPDGIEIDDAVKQRFENQREHDPSDLAEARELADTEEGTAIGLFYRNETADRYDAFTAEGIATTRDVKLAALESQLDRYQI